MRIEKKKDIIEIMEAVKISQEDQDVILEKGDRIEVLKERKIPVSWEETGGLAEEVFQALEDAGIEVRFDYSDYEREEVIKLKYGNSRYELGISEID